MGAQTATAQTLRRRLLARGVDWPGPIEHLRSVGSTNDLLKERAREGAPEWSVVLADEQTAGRGRQGRIWLSPGGNLYVSVLLRPAASAERLGVLPLAAGVAVAEAVAEWGVAARLKWPNDVVARDRKLGGLLTEASSGGDRVEWVALGIGVNLALHPNQAPPELRGAVTSVQAETGRELAAPEAGAAVLAHLRVWYDALARDGVQTIVAAWRARSLPWWGRTVEVRSGETLLRGVARGVDARGALVVELPDGSLATVLSGEARELRLQPEDPR